MNTDRIETRARQYQPERQNRTAAAIQSEIEFMRAMYCQRRCLNRRRHEAMVGWSLITVAVAVPAIAAAAVLILR
jgi:hypothetical protein